VTGAPKGFPRRGEIYWADLPEGDGSAQAGTRPVVVVSNDVNNQHSPVVVVAALTRTIPAKQYPQNVHLPAGAPLQDAGTILCNQLFTLDKSDLREYRATLDANQIPRLDAALATALGL
jgi:mRNA interferase MazF